MTDYEHNRAALDLSYKAAIIGNHPNLRTPALMMVLLYPDFVLGGVYYKTFRSCFEF
jgi:hypothetical protein